MDKNELKISALREDLASAMDRIADLRVELTLTAQQFQEAKAKIIELEQYKWENEEAKKDVMAVEQEETSPEDEAGS